MKKLLLIVAGILLMFSSCKKFLDEKSDKSFAVPNTLTDLQAIFDNALTMTTRDGTTADISTGDYYITDAGLNARTDYEKILYTWQKADMTTGSNDWTYNYAAIYRTNIVLNSIDNIERTVNNQLQWDFIKGQAYFYRGKSYLRALYVYAPAYDELTASKDLGVVLREGIDFNVLSVRSTVEECYNQVISDLKNAIRYLPDVSIYTSRPSKPAAYGMLARAYWSMRNYDQALLYADSGLRIKHDLMDFNTLTASDPFPVPSNNIEIWHESVAASSLLGNSLAKLHPELVNLYENNDLRKTVFLKDNGDGTYGFKGSYESSTSCFSGVATDEILLIRAECYARANKLTEALSDLNTLLKTRYKTGTYTDKVSNDQQAVLDMILTERRKELLMRGGLRWIDVKRLNKEGAGIEFSRTYNGVNYKITPNSNGFVIAIPINVIQLTGMPQNP